MKHETIAPPDPEDRLITLLWLERYVAAKTRPQKAALLVEKPIASFDKVNDYRLAPVASGR